MMKFRRKTFGGLALAVASITVLAACSSSSSSPSASASSGAPVAGGTATWAELPSTTPNYIFPFDQQRLHQRDQHRASSSS